jgi:predicted MFS family arabinose efflux permease
VQSGGVLRALRQIATVPHLRSLLIWSLLGRMHQAGTPLALSFLIAGWTGSYALAGVVGGALTLGLGVAGPLRGRAADRTPASRLLVITAGCGGTGIATLSLLPTLLPRGTWPVVVAAFLTGLAMPPVTQISRATYPRMTEGEARKAVFTVEASLQELLYLVGPALAAMTVALVDARAATWLCGALAVLGALGFLFALRRSGMDQPLPRSQTETGHGRQTALLANRALLLCLAVATCIVISLAAIDMVVVAWARNTGRPALAGVLTAVWGVGSVTGGLVASGLFASAGFAARMAFMTAGVAALVTALPPVMNPASPWLIGAVLVLGGLAIVPVIATGNVLIGELAPEGRTVEAFGWMTAGDDGGRRAGAPSRGLVARPRRPRAAAAGAAALVAVLGTVLATGVNHGESELVTGETR